MANKILGILEQSEGRLKKVSFEVLSLIARLSGELKLEAEALVIGSEIENMNDASGYGVNKITHFKNINFQKYSSSAYKNIVYDYAKETGAHYIFFPNTSFGKDLSPLVAAKLGAGIGMDCIHFEVVDNDIIATRPVYAGKALIDIKLKSEVKIFTIRPNIFKPIKLNSLATNFDVKQIDNPDLKTKVIEFKKAEGKLDVAEADIIVSGGRGLKGPENFYLVENLAEELGAAIGASRAAVDAGWRPHREQVGQTGKTVSPSLYIACGISGAIQHLAGMSSSKYIVAINKDKDAPIFSIADYGIAGDLFEVIPALSNEIKRIKS